MSNNAVIFQSVERPRSPPRKTSGVGTLLILVLLIVALLVPLFVESPSHQNMAILILMAAQMGVAWNIVGGYAGQISLGQAAFYGLGAYTSTLLFARFGINPWLAMIAGGVVAALISIVIGWSCFRLKGHYFAMATIAVAEIIQILFTNWEFAGGAVGLTISMDQQGWESFVFASKVPYYYIALGLLVLILLANLIAFAISSFFTALGGSFYAQKELYIDPASVLGTGLSIKMALVAILGGIGSLFGPVIGAGILTVIDEGTRAMFGGTGRGTDLIIYAALIIVVAVYYPNGVLGTLKNWLARRQAVKSQIARGEHQ